MLLHTIGLGAFHRRNCQRRHTLADHGLPDRDLRMSLVEIHVKRSLTSLAERMAPGVDRAF